jgi:hypothetical protein
VFTCRFRENPELYCELGGEWVGNDHDAIKQLCGEFKLDLIKHRCEYSFAELGTITKTLEVGAWPFQKRMQKKLRTAARDVIRDIRRVAEPLAKLTTDALSVWPATEGQ